MAKGRRNKEKRKAAPVHPKKISVPGVSDWSMTLKECYLGNPTVKIAGISKRFTKPQIAEIIKCSRSVEYFTMNYCRIISIDEGEVPFIPYDYQIELLKKYQDNRFVITVQARQSGKTITTAAYILWYALFHSQKTIGILANKEAQSKEILLRITQMFQGLPFFLQQGATELNKKSISFENGSRILASATSSSAIRGMSLSLLYLDEFAFVADDVNFFSSVMPTISSGKESKIIISSTPNGQRGMFHKLYTQAERGLNEYAFMNIKWDRVPGRDETWKISTILSMSGNVSQFEQEYCNNFQGSEGALLSMEYYQTMSFFNPIRNIGDFLNIYEEAKKDNKYIGVVDCAGGEGGAADSSVIQIIDVTQIPYKQVAMYRNNKISPLLFPYTVVSVCEQYNSCPVLIENNHRVGGTVSYAVYMELEYEGCLTTSPDKIRSKRIMGRNAVPGIEINKKIKAIGCSNLKTLIENDRLILVDETTINEIGVFVDNKKGSYAADQGCHDDTISPFVIFGWLTKTDWFLDYYNTNISVNVYEHQREKMAEDLLPFITSNEPEMHHTTVAENAFGETVIESSMF